MKVCVYGAASDNSQSFMSAARKIGQIIGQGGHSLTYGGFSKGILGEVAKECGTEIFLQEQGAGEYVEIFTDTEQFAKMIGE